jgi:hypothetical protein
LRVRVIGFRVGASSISTLSTLSPSKYNTTFRAEFPVSTDILDAEVSAPDLEALKEINNREWYGVSVSSQQISRLSDQIALIDKNSSNNSGPWKFESIHFDLRHGKSIQTAPLYVCFDYDAAHDIEISYNLSAENVPDIASGKLTINVEDSA